MECWDSSQLLEHTAGVTAIRNRFILPTTSLTVAFEGSGSTSNSTRTLVEREYERTDNCLADAIQSLMIGIFGATNEGELFHQNFGWWPTCTRFLEIDSLCVTWDFIHQLRALLIGNVKDWRVNIHVYNPLKGEVSPAGDVEAAV